MDLTVEYDLRVFLKGCFKKRGGGICQRYAQLNLQPIRKDRILPTECGAYQRFCSYMAEL